MRLYVRKDNAFITTPSWSIVHRLIAVTFAVLATVGTVSSAHAQGDGPGGGALAEVAVYAYACPAGYVADEAGAIGDAAAACVSPQAGVDFAVRSRTVESQPVVLTTGDGGYAAAGLATSELGYDIQITSPPGSINYLVTCSRSDGGDPDVVYTEAGFQVQGAANTDDRIACEVYFLFTGAPGGEPTQGTSSPSDDGTETGADPAPAATETTTGENPTTAQPTETAGAATTDADASADPRGATGTGSPVAIYAGACDTVDLTVDPVAVLSETTLPEGDAQGADTASAVETSLTTLDLPLADILADDHVLVVFDEDDDTAVLACGAIGGIVTEDGTLAFGVAAVGESRFSGVATLTVDGDQTEATVFLAEDLSADATPTS